jgi:hypothetical protein
MLFSFLYLAVGALFGLLIRCRRGPDVKDERHAQERVLRVINELRPGTATRALTRAVSVSAGRAGLTSRAQKRSSVQPVPDTIRVRHAQDAVVTSVRAPDCAKK